MKQVFYIIILLSIGITYSAHAQPPGYLGKRAYVSLGLSSKPALQGPTKKGRSTTLFDDDFKLKKHGLDYEFDLNFSYVIARNRTLGLTIGQYYTGMDSYATTISYLDDFNSANPRTDRHNLFLRLNVRSIALISSKFKTNKGGLAPLGNHLFYGLKRTFVTGEISDKKTTFASEAIGAVQGHRPIGIENEKVAYNTLLIGWTNNQIFFDKLIVKSGFRFGIPLNIEAYAGLSGNIPTIRYADPEQESLNRNSIRFEYNVYDRIVRHEGFRIDVSVGYLLF